MSKATRMLAMTGMALVAGATMAAGPAAASSSTAQGTTSATQSTQQQAKTDRGRDRDWVAGYYRTRLQCERVGRIGERFDRWDDYECERVRRGFRVIWRLDVERDWHGGGDWDNHHGGGNWDNDNDHHGGGHWNNNRPRR